MNLEINKELMKGNTRDKKQIITKGMHRSDNKNQKTKSDISDTQ